MENKINGRCKWELLWPFWALGKKKTWLWRNVAIFMNEYASHQPGMDTEEGRTPNCSLFAHRFLGSRAAKWAFETGLFACVLLSKPIYHSNLILMQTLQVCCSSTQLDNSILTQDNIMRQVLAKLQFSSPEYIMVLENFCPNFHLLVIYMGTRSLWRPDNSIIHEPAGNSLLFC